MTPTVFQVPANVLAGVRRRWPDRAEGWGGRVIEELRDICARYGAKPIRVHPARYGLVVSVATPDSLLVLRASPDPMAANQAAVAKSLADLGIAPAVHEFILTSTGAWTVMDEVRPGIPVADRRFSAATVGAFASTLRPLLGAPAPLPDLPSVGDWLQSRLVDDHPSDLAPGRAVASAVERRRAVEVLADLARENGGGLCHGDPSPWNVLLGEGGRLYLVDPRGLRGTVSYDAAVVVLKAERFAPAAEVAPVLASQLGLDLEELLAWVVVADAARV